MLSRQKITAQRFFRNQAGMTGLETAIILIAFVTVASILAYSVLTAGIFSAERGKETIYAGLDQAQASLEVKGSVLGYSSDNNELSSVRIKLGLVHPNEEVDKSSVIATFFDDSYSAQLTSSNFTLTKLSGSVERGSSDLIERDEVWEMVVNVPLSASVNSNDWFVIQIVPPKGASIHIKKDLPEYLDTYMDLN